VDCCFVVIGRPPCYEATNRSDRWSQLFALMGLAGLVWRRIFIHICDTNRLSAMLYTWSLYTTTPHIQH